MYNMPFKPTWLYKKLLCYIQSYKPMKTVSERKTHVVHVQHMYNTTPANKKEQW